jgi:hypothetical protein
MSSARFWHGSRLIAGWIVAIGGFLLLRWVLARGVVRGVLQDGRVERLGGVWSAGFATFATYVGGGALAAALVWLTASWIAGRRDRAVLRHHPAPAHRRILM